MKDPFIAAFIVLLVMIAIWEAIWKAISMWKSACNNQLAWFICIVVLNTAGILPILYITLFQKKDVPPAIRG